MEVTILTFLTLVAWVAAIYATITFFKRMKRQGEYVMAGRPHINVPIRWPAVVAAAAWLWIVAGWML